MPETSVANGQLLGEALFASPTKLALRFNEGQLTYGELERVSRRLASEIAGLERVAVWAEPRIETAIAVVAGLRAGATLIPINPKLGALEFRHELADCRPQALLCRVDAELSDELGGLRRITVDRRPSADGGEQGKAFPTAPAARLAAKDAPAFVLYTSGTTGMPKGVALSWQAIASNIDALAQIWGWGGRDTVVQALPLFHAHGLILGVVGTLRLGGTARHLGRFEPETLAEALASTESAVLFAVPTMYHRLAEACESDAGLAAKVGRARLLVSGSAALPAREHERIERLTGKAIVERYGLSETLMLCSTRPEASSRPGTVGLPLPGVELRLTDEAGAEIEAWDGETIGEIEVETPSLFEGYLNLPEVTAACQRDGWFRTGDMAVREPDGYVRIVGRRSTDLIKTGGFRVGAGEVEAALLEHESVREAAVAGLPDEDLGEIIVAWVVPAAGAQVSAEELIEHCRRLLSSHKRPRQIRFLDELPRNALGKVQKKRLLELGSQPLHSFDTAS